MIFISKVDGQNVSRGFAVCEAFTYNESGVVLTVCYKSGIEFFECLANLKDSNGNFIIDYDHYAFTSGNESLVV